MNTTKTLEATLQEIAQAIETLNRATKTIVKYPEFEALDMEPQDEVLFAVGIIKQAAVEADSAFWDRISRIL